MVDIGSHLPSSEKQTQMSWSRVGLDPHLKHLSNQAQRLLAEKQWEDLSADEIKFIKDHYMGRHQFGAVYTDYALARIMVSILNPKNGSILDPCCGSGRLLEFLPDNLKVVCYEIDPKAAALCRFLYPRAVVYVGNALSKLNEVRGKFDYCIAGPPWGLRAPGYDEYELADIGIVRNSIVLFLELCIASLKDGGKGVIILPIFFYEPEFHLAWEFIAKNTCILAEIKFPETVYYSSNVAISGAILLLKKTRDREVEKFECSIHKNDWVILGDNMTLAEHVIDQVLAHVGNQ